MMSMMHTLIMTTLMMHTLKDTSLTVVLIILAMFYIMMHTLQDTSLTVVLILLAIAARLWLLQSGILDVRGKQVQQIFCIAHVCDRERLGRE